MSGGRFIEQLSVYASEQERFEYEKKLAREPNRGPLIEYLVPLIDDILDRVEIVEDSARLALMEKIKREIPRAAHLYIAHANDPDQTYPFSVYFSWFAKEILSEQG